MDNIEYFFSPGVRQAGTAPMNEKLHFALLVMPGFSLLSLGAFIDKLRFSADDEDYSRQIHCSWCVTGLDALPVYSSANVSVTPDIPLAQLAQSRAEAPTYLVIFGSNRVEEVCRLSERYIPLITRLHRNKVRLVSVDNAAFLLAAAGLARHRKLVLHWRHLNQYRQAFPQHEVISDRIFYEDGGIISCVGGSATVEAAVYILEKHIGSVRALKGLADMIVDTARPAQQSDRGSPEHAALSRSVSRAITLMQHAIGRKTSMAALALTLGVSRRQLDRDFLKDTGVRGHDYFMALKIAQAQWLLRRTSQSLTLIAQDVGMNDASYLCRAFKRATGLTPRQYREQHRETP